MIDAILNYSFLQNAILAGALAGILCGVVGAILSEKKMLMMCGGIAHTAYGGVGLGYLLGFEPIIGAGIFAALSAFIIGAVKRKGGVHSDVIISLLWALGMASGVAFLGLMPSYPPDMNSYLFGNVLSVTRGDILVMLPFTVIVLLTVAVFYNDFCAFLFDERFAKVMGIKTAFLEYLLLIFTALSIVVLIRVVGIILVIALLTAPAACATLISKSLKNRMIISALFGCLFCFVGLTVSYYWGISSGATIVFVAVVSYFVLFATKKLLTHFKKC